MSYGYRYNSDFWDGWIPIVLLVVLVLTIIAAAMMIPVMTKEVATVKVEEKFIKNSGGTGVYLLSTDRGMYSIHDTWILGQWRSSDLYAKTKPGKSYELKYWGWRFGPLSWYPNIYEMEEVRPVGKTE